LVAQRLCAVSAALLKLSHQPHYLARKLLKISISHPWLEEMLHRYASEVAAVCSDANGKIKIGWGIVGNGGDAVLRFQWQERGGPLVDGGHDDLMQKRSFRGSGKPVWVNAL
jgi:hypothetical protein